MTDHTDTLGDESPDNNNGLSSLTREESGPAKGERIAKALARAGIGSRRDVERMVEEGRIKVNGQTLVTPAFLIDTLAGVMVDGKPVETAPDVQLWRFHKTRGMVTTHKDPEGRPTVFRNLPQHIGRVVSVGRLDMNTEGLLLVTNDGSLARYLELPENNHIRRYRVRVYGTVNQEKLAGLQDGATIDGIHYGPIKAELEAGKSGERKQESANCWIRVAITEGKNREVRRVMEHMGLTVSRLVRTHYGPFNLGTLAQGTTERVGTAKLVDLLPDFFADRPESISQTISTPASREKWAKSKPKHTHGVKKRTIVRSRDSDKTNSPPKKKTPYQGKKGASFSQHPATASAAAKSRFESKKSHETTGDSETQVRKKRTDRTLEPKTQFADKPTGNKPTGNKPAPTSRYGDKSKEGSRSKSDSPYRAKGASTSGPPSGGKSGGGKSGAKSATKSKFNAGSKPRSKK